MTRVIVSGDRNWPCFRMASLVLDRLRKRYGAENLVIVHGHCPTGVDREFERVAGFMNIKRERHPADWERLGDRAGPIRNQEMVDLGASFCIACHPFIRDSRGTKDCARRAIEAGIPAWLISDDSGEPRRLRIEDIRSDVDSDTVR